MKVLASLALAGVCMVQGHEQRYIDILKAQLKASQRLNKIKDIHIFQIYDPDEQIDDFSFLIVMNALVATFDVDGDGLIDFNEALGLSHRLLADFVYYALLTKQEKNCKWPTFLSPFY